jgi:hypothetical protein
MAATAESVTERYSYERLCFDRWAAWAEGQWEQGLGFPRETLLSKVGRMGIRVGAIHASNEPEIRDEPEIVSALMEEWAQVKPLPHCALLARHRRIIRGVKITQLTDSKGKPQRMTDRDFALLIIGKSTDSAKRSFQRLCAEGYAELRERLRAAPAQ